MRLLLTLGAVVHNVGAYCSITERRPIQLAILQDLTESMDDICAHMYKVALSQIVTTLGLSNFGSEWGLMSFKDKPLMPLGNQATESNAYEDYCAQLEVDFTSNLTTLREWYLEVNPQGGGDPEEAQFYAIYRAAASGEFSWSDDAYKLILLITDSPPHFPGDGKSDSFDFDPFTGVFPSLINGSTTDECLTQDYPSADQVKSILNDRGIALSALVVDEGKAVDAWQWFNDHMEQDASLIQSISMTGLDIALKYHQIQAVVSAESCLAARTETSTVTEVATQDLTASVGTAASGLETLLPEITLFPSATDAAESTVSVELATLPTRPYVPGFPTEDAAAEETSPAPTESATVSTTGGFLSRTTQTTSEEECSVDALSTTSTVTTETTISTAYLECLLEKLPATHVITPSSITYLLSTIPYNLAINPTQPIAIIYCSSVEEVQHAVYCSAQHKIKMTPRSGGHDYSGFSFGTSDSVVIDVSALNAISVNQTDGTADIGPGAKVANVWYNVYQLGGYMLPIGACTTVGMGGHILGGSYGFYSRAFGIGSDYVSEIDIVLANGTMLTVSYGSDLFWALRGGGNGNFGVVTRFKFVLIVAPEVWTSGTILWSNKSDHKQVLQALADWADDVPPGLAVSLAAGVNRTIIQAAYPGDIDQFWAAMEPLMNTTPTNIFSSVRQGNWLESVAELSIPNMNAVDAVGVPPVGWTVGRSLQSTSNTPSDIASDTPSDRTTNTTTNTTTIRPSNTLLNATVPVGLNTLFWLNGSNTPTRSRFRGHSGFWLVDDYRFNETSVNVLDEMFQDGPYEFAYSLELFGGQQSRINVDVDSAFPHRNAQFIIHMYIRASEVFNPTLEFEYVTTAYHERLRPLMAPNIYANYHDFTLDEGEAQEAYYVQNYDKLRTIKTRYDPEHLFWFQQSIRPSV